MGIKRIAISNFKSFKNIDIKLDKFNVLIGGNASGKSNFVQIFKFLRDLTNFGFDNAISMQGGVDYFLNTNLGLDNNFSIEVVMDVHDLYPPILISPEKQIGFETYELVYKLVTRFGRLRSQFEILKDNLIFKCIFSNYINDRKGLRKELGDLGKGEIIISRNKDAIALQVKGPDEVKQKEAEKDVFIINSTRDMLSRYKLGSMDTILEIPYMVYLRGHARNIFERMAIYDFDPKMSKRAQAITGKADLEEDGSNLTVVLNNILKSGERIQFYDILTDLLPFVDKVHTKKFANSLIFQLRETYYKHKFLPSFLISDGTINLTALVVALFFQSKSLKIIEEPERNIHPYLISRVVELMRDASEKEQIITTSHNPEVVRYAEPDEILLVYRTKDGFSDVSKPADKYEIKAFLDNEMGISELYVQHLLERYIE